MRPGLWGGSPGGPPGRACGTNPLLVWAMDVLAPEVEATTVDICLYLYLLVRYKESRTGVCQLFKTVEDL